MDQTTNTTLLDIAKANGSDAVVGLIDETVKAHPEVEYGSARTIKGLGYKTLVRTALPTASFRAANEGVVQSKSQWSNRYVETFILNPRIECDKAIADRYEDGAEAFLALEGEAQMEAGLITVAKQFYYGLANDAKGFPGLIDAYDSTNMVVDAGGTTDGTATSVWAVKFGPKNVTWVYGNEGELSLTDPRIESVTDNNTPPRKFTAYVQEILAYPGLQVGNIQAIGRIKKITADVGHTLNDALLGSLLAKFQVGTVPDVFFVSRRSLEQLRASRTATNAMGAPAPTPTEYQGIPIRPTDSIVNTETLAL